MMCVIWLSIWAMLATILHTGKQKNTCNIDPTVWEWVWEWVSWLSHNLCLQETEIVLSVNWSVCTHTAYYLPTSIINADADSYLGELQRRKCLSRWDKPWILTNGWFVYSLAGYFFLARQFFKWFPNVQFQPITLKEGYHSFSLWYMNPANCLFPNCCIYDIWDGITYSEDTTLYLPAPFCIHALTDTLDWLVSLWLTGERENMLSSQPWGAGFKLTISR